VITLSSLFFLLIGCAVAQAENKADRLAAIRAFCEAAVVPLGSEVLAELQATPAQSEAARKHLNPPPFFGSELGLLQWRKAQRIEILALFTAEQQTRLEELTLQWQGALHSLLRPTIASALKMTSQQVQQIEELYAYYRRGGENIQEYWRRYGVSGHRDAEMGVDAPRRGADTVATSILLPEQKVHFDQIRGKLIFPEPKFWRPF
jgi:hypothetical protein